MDDRTFGGADPGVCYLVTGAAGHLGSTILRQLAARGCTVRGLLRPGEAPRVSAAGITYVTGDVCAPETLRPLFAPAGDRPRILLHTAALISIAEKMPPRLYDVNVNGVKNVLALCRETGVRRLVHVSSVHAIPELPAGQVMREPAAFSAERVAGGYAKTKAEAAQAVLDAAAAGLDACVVFPSGILGPYDSGGNHLIQMMQACLQKKLPACVAGGYDFVDVRDVAQGCLAAAARGARGEGYILSGHVLSIRELLAMTARCGGVPPVGQIPLWLAQAAVPLIEADARLHGRRPLYTRYSLRTLGANCLFSHEKAARALGYTVRDPAVTVADTVAWLRTGALPGEAAPR